MGKNLKLPLGFVALAAVVVVGAAGFDDPGSPAADDEHADAHRGGGGAC